MKLLLTIALIIGLVAGAAKPFNPQSLIPEMGAHDTHLDTAMKSFKSRLRGFDAQQAEYLVPVSDAEICKGPDFVANLTKVYTLCAFVSVLPLGNQSVPSTTEGIRNAWDDFCNGVCMLAASAVFETYAVCLHPYLKLQGMAQKYLCSTRDSAGDRCGVTMSKFDEVTSCKSHSFQSTCNAASEFCSWTTTTTSSGFSYSSCSPLYTQNVLSTLCGSCAYGLAKLNNQFPQYGDSEISDGLSQLCLKAPSGAFCLPSLVQFASAGVSVEKLFLTQTGLNSVCGNNDLSYCVRAAVGQSAAAQVAKARARFISCARTYSNVTSSINSYCLPSLKSSLNDARGSSRNIELMCLKNADGNYCIPLSLTLMTNPCVLFALGLGTCTSACASNVSSLVSSLGCCIGNIQGFATGNDDEEGPLSPEDLPFIPGYTGDSSTLAPMPTMAPAPGTTAPVVLGSGEELIPNPVDGGLYGLGVCNVDGLNQTLRKRCAVPAAAKVSGSILVPIVYSEINANPARKMRVKGSLRVDVATTAQVPPESIVDDDIVEAPSVKVATSAGRRQSGSTTASGCQYKYTIKAASTTDANLAASNVNNAASSGRVPLTSTQATLSNECASTCAGSGGVSSIDQVQSGSSSSMRVASTCLAIVAATLLLLL